MAKLGREYLIGAVRKHAERYYDAGWDVVQETMTDEQIGDLLGRTRTVTGAVTTIADAVVAPRVEQMVEARPGEDDDPQLKTLELFNAERRANRQDATLWWPQDERDELLRRMQEPEGAITSVPAPRSEQVPENTQAAQTPKPRKTGAVKDAERSERAVNRRRATGGGTDVPRSRSRARV
jgi:hypothetical protein